MIPALAKAIREAVEAAIYAELERASFQGDPIPRVRLVGPVRCTFVIESTGQTPTLVTLENGSDA